jgi:hypothetical protein
MPASASDLADLISRGGVVVVLVFAVWGFYNEKWVSGSTYQRAIKERDQFRDELLTTLRVADRATRLTERTVDLADSHPVPSIRRLRRQRGANEEE